MTAMTAMTSPFYCPYCGEQDLRPEPEPSGAWRCGDCLRVFTVSFQGLVPPPAGRPGQEVGS